jgi:hypothetical protein
MLSQFTSHYGVFMKRPAILLAFSLLAAPLSTAHAEAQVPVEFAAMFSEGEVRVALDMERLEQELTILLSKSSLSLEDQSLLSAAMLKVVESAASGNVIEAWQASQELREVWQNIKTKKDQVTTRGFFDIFKGIGDLISSVRAGDFWGILKALWTIISALD